MADVDALDVGQPVLPLDATRALTLTDALVAWVPPQQVSTLVRALDRDRETQQACAHLKRVHRGAKPPPSAIAVAAQGSAGGKNALLAVMLCIGGTDILSEEVNNILAGCGVQPQVVPVPKHPPLTRKQFEDWGTVWPLHFHEAAAIRSLGPWTDGTTAEEEHDAMRGHMRRAIALAEEHAAKGGRGVAAVAVRDGVRIAECVDATRGADGGATAAAATSSFDDDGASAISLGPPHPLGHAVLLCIEEVAKLERQMAERMPRKRPATSVEAIAAVAAAEVAAASSTRACSTAAGGAAASTAAGTSAQSSVPSSSSATGPDDSACGSAEGEENARASTATNAAAAAAAPHLCAGVDLYVTLEPCAMCAMALVHSRVRRLIYALPAPEGGALGSRYRLHAEKSLNHHFCVLRGSLRCEAEAAKRLEQDTLGS